MAIRKGRTVLLARPIPVIGYGSVVGKKEGEGPLGRAFDEIVADARFGEKTFEQAESKMQKQAVRYAIQRAGISENQVDVITAGDLLNQCIGSSFGLMETEIPFLGVYGACSTMALSLMINASMVESGAVKTAVSVTSSHFCSAERQYRFPLEYGGVRPQTSQWTVTGAGAMVLQKDGVGKAAVSSFCAGKIVDLKVTDQNNMGAAMAPAACDTILTYLKDTETRVGDYDGIYTGDLGSVGTELLYRLSEQMGKPLAGHHADFGKMIYDPATQDVHAGGSGCGCSASLLCSYIMQRFNKEEIHRMLYCATGALLSPTSVLQGQSIPGICHLIELVAI